MNMLRRLLVVLASFLVVSCGEIRTEDSQQAYKYWAEENVPQDVRVLRGQYWQSGHFTKEYVVYLELLVSQEWAQGFIRQNQLVEQKERSSFLLDSPVWFKPDSTFKDYSAPNGATHHNYHFQPKTGRMFIYEAQL